MASRSVSSIVWRTITWSGSSIGPVTFSWQAAGSGNTAAIRSSASMRWIGGGFLRPPFHRSTRSDRLRFQRQRDRNIGDGGTSVAWVRVCSTEADRRNLGHVGEREAVLRAEREHHGVVVRRRLQLEVEVLAELLAQRQTEPPVEPGPVGAVDDQLHAAGLVEEALDHQSLAGGQHPQDGERRRQVPHDLARRLGIDSGRAHQPGSGGVGITTAKPQFDFTSDGADLFGQLGRTARRLAEPDRNGGRKALGIDDAHHAGLDAPDPPAVGPQREDVARHRLGRPVLVDGADEGVVGVEQHPIVAQLGDGTATGERRHAGASPAPQPAVLDIVVDPVRSHAPPGAYAFGDHGETGVEVLTRQRPERMGPAHEPVELVDRPLLGRDLGHDLLDQDVERLLWG